MTGLEGRRVGREACLWEFLPARNDAAVPEGGMTDDLTNLKVDVGFVAGMLAGGVNVVAEGEQVPEEPQGLIAGEDLL